MLSRLKAAGNRALRRLVEARQAEADRLIERRYPQHRVLRDQDRF